MKKITTITSLFIGLVVFSFNVNAGMFIKTAKSGVQDNHQASLIEKYNSMQRLRIENNFKILADELEKEKKSLKPSDFGYYRVLNQLSNIYSYHLLDIEKAVDLDQKILNANLSSNNRDKFVPTAKVANQIVLASKSYIDNYISVSDSELKSRAKKRLLKNRELLNGNALAKSTKYDQSFLNDHLSQIKNDLKGVPKSSPKYNQLLSRLIRAEYELYLVDPNYKILSYKNFSKQFSYDDVDLSEINYIDFANYLAAVYKQTNNLAFADQALKTIYKPYINLRNPQYRLNYNNLINQYIALLIDASYQKKDFAEMLYYISLNKSRMILEERLAYSSGNNLLTKISDLTANDGIKRDGYGLPTKQWFRNKIAKTNNYLDLYVDSSSILAASNISVRNLAKQDRPTRGLIRQSFDNLHQPIDKQEKIYSTYIKNGKVVSVNKLDNKKLIDLRNDLDESYSNVLNNNNSVLPNLPDYLGVSDNLEVSSLVVSPDKWLTKYPYDYLLNGNTVRSVNLLTYNTKPSRISTIQIAGFFNPTLDLAGTEYEAKIIKKQYPSAIVNIGRNAKLEALRKTSNNNIVHLSMHGVFNNENPIYSKLLFNGANKRVDENDTNSLYAKNIFKYNALKNQDLVFAAACQTGRTANTQTNQNEMVGILRPLIANGNKNVILSLWDVDDKATALFVESFYKQLAITKDIQLSFSYAQNIVKQKNADPYYWSAFYLLSAD